MKADCEGPTIRSTTFFSLVFWILALSLYKILKYAIFRNAFYEVGLVT